MKRNKKLFVPSVLIMGVFAALGFMLQSCGDDDDPIPIVYVPPANTAVSISSSSSLALLVGKCFTYADGQFLSPALIGVTTICYQNLVGTTSIEYTLTNGANTASGQAEAGSLIFEVTSSTIPGLDVGTEIETESSLIVDSEGNGSLEIVADGGTGESTNKDVICESMTCVGAVLLCDGVQIGTCQPATGGG